MAHPNAELIERFYQSFQRHDAEGMAACYAPTVRFSDTVFPNLEGERAKDMWRMLCGRASTTGLRVEYSNVHADDGHGTAHWEAWYNFGPQKRPVHNIIDAHFHFHGGLISEHFDSFGFWRWSRQAIGPAGVLLGWTPIIHGAVRKQAAAQLDAFQQKKTK
jgi:hypothetical protein